MSRNFTPTVLLDAKGSLIKHPEYRRGNEPKAKRALGPPPKYLSADLRALWKEIAKRQPEGVLLETDRDGFEMMVRLTYKMRTEPEKLDTVEARAQIMTSAERSTLISLWSRFAMTPADRCKVQVEKPKEGGLADFLKKRKAKPTPPPPAEPPAEEPQSLIN